MTRSTSLTRITSPSLVGHLDLDESPASVVIVALADHLPGYLRVRYPADRRHRCVRPRNRGAVRPGFRAGWPERQQGLDSRRTAPRRLAIVAAARRQAATGGGGGEPRDVGGCSAD